MKANYRPDIDGLRAVAVLAVLCFHAFPKALAGGFVGVDVFFVISGFLITGIILEGLRTGRFTFVHFYARRIRRIFPALFIVLLTSLLAGWVLLFPVDFRNLGHHVLAGAGFFSNLALWHESGYFDTAAETKPLLHLWSLGVEEQYYAIWPVLLVLTNRGLQRIMPLIVLVAVVSFVLNVLLIDSHPTGVFYSPPTRFWELMIGSALAYVQIFNAQLNDTLRAHANALATVGVGLLLIALVITSESKFPGWWALLPTIGSVCIIAAGGKSVVSRWLANRQIVHIGLISYPLYLWHWPLLTFARIYVGGVPSVSVRLAILALCFLLADLTFRYVEGKLRLRTNTWVVASLSTSIGVVAVVALLVSHGQIPAASASVPHLAEVSEAITDWEDGKNLVRGDTERAVLFFGDSHMQQYWARIAKVIHDHRAPIRTIVFHTAGGCAPIVGIDRPEANCAEFAQTGYERGVQPDVDVVVISCAWLGFLTRTDYFDVLHRSDGPLDLRGPQMDEQLKSFEKSLRTLREHGKQVVILLSSPRDKAFDPALMLHRVGWMNWSVELSAPVSRDKIEQLRKQIDPRIRAVALEVGASVVDPVEYLCSAKWCPALDATGHPLYKDWTHLRASTARDLFTALDQFIYVPNVAADTAPQVEPSPRD